MQFYAAAVYVSELDDCQSLTQLYRLVQQVPSGCSGRITLARGDGICCSIYSSPVQRVARGYSRRQWSLYLPVLKLQLKLAMSGPRGVRH
eukprot:COSAG02_NODE_817_length_16825_cov_49.127646_13_plen_90_part_00